MILPLVAQIKDVPYKYENHIQMDVLEDYREVITKKDWVKKWDTSDIQTENWMVEEKISYLHLSIYTVISLVGLGYCIKNIEKINLENTQRSSKRRTL